MASPSTATRVSARRHRTALAPATRFDRRLAEILTHATEVFCKKGYEGASMRDLSRASGMSLAGLYYYFESKERLLFLIQKHTFTTIVQRLKARLEGVSDPEQQVRIFILNHLEYFLANQEAMKVLSHEAEALKNGFAAEVAAIKREYYRICVGLLDELKSDRGFVVFHADRGTQPVWHDELDLYLAQSAGGCRCRATRARDERHFSARRDERQPGAQRCALRTDLFWFPAKAGFLASRGMTSGAFGMRSGCRE